MIGRNGERGSGISALAVRHDDDDEKKIQRVNSAEKNNLSEDSKLNEN